MGSPEYNVLPRAAWDEITRNMGRQQAEKWRVNRGIQVEGMPPVAQATGELPPVDPTQVPVYPQPLDAVAAPQAPQQGTPSMPPSLGALPTVEGVYGDQNTLSQSILDFMGSASKRRADQYAAATEELKKRRFGPSQAEQLFALSAALAKPTYAGNRFGQVLGNVTPTLADIEKATRTAEEERSAAAQALREKYLSGQEGTEMAVLQERRKALSDRMELAKVLAKPGPEFKSVIVENGVPYDPISGEKLVQPSEAAWQALATAPTQANVDQFIRTFGPRFADKAQRLLAYPRGGQ